MWYTQPNAYIYKRGCRGNTGQLDKDLMVKDTDIAYKKGGHKLS